MLNSYNKRDIMKNIFLSFIAMILLILTGYSCSSESSPPDANNEENENNTEFTVVSTTPVNGATSVSINTQISLTFSDTLGSYSAGNSTNCADHLFQLSTDNFSTCTGWDSSSFYTINGSTITLEASTLSLSTTYQLRVVASASGEMTLTSLDGTPVTSSTISFTTDACDDEKRLCIESNPEEYICDDERLCIESVSFSDNEIQGSPNLNFTFNKSYNLGGNGSSQTISYDCRDQIMIGWNSQAPILISSDNFKTCEPFGLSHDDFEKPKTLMIQPLNIGVGDYQIVILKYSSSNDMNFTGFDNQSLVLKQNFLKKLTIIPSL